jgi:8-oxo-dGTP pyrophosphatase MutT (NUDIX family)
LTDLAVGVVDVFLVDPGEDFRVLLLRRAQGVRCTGAWEAVHGRIEPAEAAEDAAVREIAEETGLSVRRLYSITTNPFYVVKSRTVQVAVVFCAFVDSQARVVLSDEHDACEWMSLDAAVDRVAWPRSRQALRDIHHLLRTGDAGPVDDVLRVV